MAQQDLIQLIISGTDVEEHEAECEVLRKLHSYSAMSHYFGWTEVCFHLGAAKQALADQLAGNVESARSEHNLGISEKAKGRK